MLGNFQLKYVSHLSLSLSLVSISTNISPRAQISQERNQNLARAQTQQIDAENKEMLQQILANQQNLAQVVQLHQAGESIAREVMEEGQKVNTHTYIPFFIFSSQRKHHFFFLSIGIKTHEIRPQSRIVLVEFEWRAISRCTTRFDEST